VIYFQKDGGYLPKFPQKCHDTVGAVVGVWDSNHDPVPFSYDLTERTLTVPKLIDHQSGRWRIVWVEFNSPVERAYCKLYQSELARLKEEGK